MARMESRLPEVEQGVGAAGDPDPRKADPIAMGIRYELQQRESRLPFTAIGVAGSADATEYVEPQQPAPF